MERLGIRYELLAHESDILRLHFWDRAFALLKESGAIRLETEGKNAGCWVAGVAHRKAEGDHRSSSGFIREERTMRVARAIVGAEGAARDDKIIVRSNGTVTYTGKDIAYQLWKLGQLDRDFRYQRHRTYDDGLVLWTSTSGEGEPGAPAFGHARGGLQRDRRGPVLPAARREGGRGGAGPRRRRPPTAITSPTRRSCSPPPPRARSATTSPRTTTSVKVSGRKGLGVKADDLLDALVAKARTRDRRARSRSATPPRASATARAIATGALRYFLLKFGRTKIITFDMEEALAFTGETGPYVQNGVVRARNIFAKLEAEGHARSRAAGAGARRSTSDALLAGEEGDEVWSLLLLMARSEEIVEQAVQAEEVALLAKHAFAVAQAFHSYYQKPKYSVLHAESDELRAFRALVVDAFVRQMDVLTDLLGIPIPERM